MSPVTNEARVIARLETEIETLRAANAALRRELVPDQWLPPLAGLTRFEGLVLVALLNRDFVSRDGLLTLLYGHLPAPPDVNIISVWLCRLRKKLAPLGVSVETTHGQGYRISAGDKVRLRALREAA